MKRWPKRVAIGMVAIVASIAGGQYALSKGLAGITEVAVSGTSRIPSRQIQSAAGIEVGDNALTVDLAAAKERVESIPLVQSAAVTRSGVLSIHIEVSERTPALVVRQGSSISMLDEDGVEVEGSIAGLPVLEIDKAAQLDPPVIRGAIRLRDRLLVGERKIAKFGWGPVNGLTLRLGKRTLLLGDPSNLGEKLTAWRRIRSSFSKDPMRVDLSEYPRVAIT